MSGMVQTEDGTVKKEMDAKSVSDEWKQTEPDEDERLVCRPVADLACDMANTRRLMFKCLTGIRVIEHDFVKREIWVDSGEIDFRLTYEWSDVKQCLQIQQIHAKIDDLHWSIRTSVLMYVYAFAVKLSARTIIMHANELKEVNHRESGDTPFEDTDERTGLVISYR
jgi:hypothetical protein